VAGTDDSALKERVFKRVRGTLVKTQQNSRLSILAAFEIRNFSPRCFLNSVKKLPGQESQELLDFMRGISPHFSVPNLPF